MTTATEILRQAHDAFLRRDLDGIAALVAEDVLIENPFAPEGYPTRLEGRENFRARLAERFANTAAEFDKIDPLVVYQTTDPELIVAEFEIHGRVPSKGISFTRQYIQVIRVRDGKFVQWRDYFNPAQVPASS
jgi:ketosteroid isomerase-like protein